MPDINKALYEANDTAGGYLVPDVLASRILELVTAKAVTINDCEQIKMASDNFRLPKETSGTTAYLVPELGTITESQAGFGRVNLVPKKFASVVRVSSELLEDANVPLANHIMNMQVRDLALAIDNQVLNGTGGDGFAGLRYTGSFTNSVSADGTIGGTASANISLMAISKAVDEVLKDNQEQPDVFYVNPRTVGSLRLLTDSTGRPIWDNNSYGSPLLKEGAIGTVYGMSIKPTTQLPINISLGTGADATLTEAIVAKSQQYGIFGIRRNVQINKDYLIDTDDWKYQANIRAGFAVKYPDAYCVIRSIRN